MLNRVKALLEAGVVQRIICGLGLTLWTVLLWDRVINPIGATSSLGISYSTFYVVPAGILALQIALNNRFLWALIFGLVTCYVVVLICMAVTDAIVRSGNHVKAIDWNVRDFVELLVFFGIAIFMDVVIWKIRPKRRQEPY